MNILGISPIQIIIILLIMLVVAGPKRMMEWAYHLGKYTAQIRGMVNEAMGALQKEMAESGLDVTKDLADIRSAGFDIVKEASKVMNIDPISTKPAATPTTPPTTPVTMPSTPVSPTPAETAATSAASSATSASNGGSSSSEPDSPATSNDEKSRYDAWLQN